MRNVSDKSCRENQTHFVFNNSCQEYLAVYDITWKIYFRAGQTTDDNMAHPHCMLDN